MRITNRRIQLVVTGWALATLPSPAQARYLQVDPVGYDDQVNLYAYVGNDPVNMVDPDGRCINRDKDGECLVTNRLGSDGARAASDLQAQVRRVDHAIRNLDLNQRVRVDIGGGRMREMTGGQLAKDWARTDWVVTRPSNGGTTFANGYGAQMDNRRFSGTPEYLELFRQRAREGGRNDDEATRSVVLHDFGHSTRVGRNILDHSYPGSSLDVFNAQERATSRLGQAIGSAIGESFECRTFGLGC